MTIEFPKNRKEITDQMKIDVRSELGPNSNPFLRNSALASLIFGAAARIFDFFSQLQFLLKNMFMDTATGSFLERWGSYVGIGRIPASVAEGFITIEGTLGSVIPNATAFQSTSQVEYTSSGESVVADPKLSVSSIILVGSEAVVVTETPHNYASGITVTITGADQFAYNGSFVVTVTDVSQFTYAVTGTPVTPATGTIKATALSAQVKLISIDFGESANLNSGESVSLTTPIIGVDNTGFVQFDGIVGGENIEDDASLRNRILDRYQNPVSFFNVAEIEQKAKTVAGVTRVFVQEITPEPGAITVFFVKDNDTNIIPVLIDRQRVKKAILEIKPGHVFGGSVEDPDSGDIHVPVLIDLKVEFVFSAVDPDTPSLRESIIKNLDQVFRGSNQVGVNISKFTYQCAIFDSFDDAGNKVKSFTLSFPTTDIIVASNEIATLGSVIFP